MKLGTKNLCSILAKRIKKGNTSRFRMLKIKRKSMICMLNRLKLSQLFSIKYKIITMVKATEVLISRKMNINKRVGRLLGDQGKKDIEIGEITSCLQLKQNQCFKCMRVCVICIVFIIERERKKHKYFKIENIFIFQEYSSFLLEF